MSLSGSGSKAPSSRSRSVSIQARSRTHSLIQSISAASRSNISFDMGMRSRADSLGRLSEVASVHRHSGESATGSVSGTSQVILPTQLDNPEDYTFGQPIRLRVESPESSENKRREGPKSEHSPKSSVEEEVAVVPAEVSEADPARAIVDQTCSNVFPSEHSSRSVDEPEDLQVQRQGTSATLPIPTSGPRPLREGLSFISSANESLITRPTSQEGSSDTAGRTPSSYGTITYVPEHVHAQSGGGWQPA